jgi:hypothetical protein
VKFVSKKCKTTNFSLYSFVVVLDPEPGIWDPRSYPGSAILQKLFLYYYWREAKKDLSVTPVYVQIVRIVRDSWYRRRVLLRCLLRCFFHCITITASMYLRQRKPKTDGDSSSISRDTPSSMWAVMYVQVPYTLSHQNLKLLSVQFRSGDRLAT